MPKRVAGGTPIDDPSYQYLDTTHRIGLHHDARRFKYLPVHVWVWHDRLMHQPHETPPTDKRPRRTGGNPSRQRSDMIGAVIILTVVFVVAHV